MKIRKRNGKKRSKIGKEREKERLRENKIGLLINKESRIKSWLMTVRRSVNS